MRTRLSLLEPHEIRGQWWLPGTPDVCVPGTLSYGPHAGTYLRLEGALEEAGYAFVKGPPIIFGVGLDAQPITIHRTLGATRQSAHTQAAGLHQDSYRVDIAYIGVHAESDADLLVRSCDLSLVGLANWLHKPAFTVESPHTLGTSAFRVALHTETVFDEPVGLIDGLRISLMNDVRGVESRGRSFELHAAPFLRLTSREATDFRMYAKHISDLRVLFSLLEHRADSVEWITVHHGAAVESSCEVLVDGVASSPPKDRASFRMFLPFSRISPSFPAVLKTWFSTDERFGGIRYEYFRTQLLGMPATPEDDILTLTQLLEGYHRRTSTETLLPTAVFDAQVRAIRAALPRAEAPELSERLDEWLRYANELTLRRRLKALLGGLDAAVVARLCESPGRFAQDALDARNALTHNLTPETGSPSIPDPAGTALRLRALLLAHLFLGVGISAEAIVEGLASETGFQGLPRGFQRVTL